MGAGIGQLALCVSAPEPAGELVNGVGASGGGGGGAELFGEHGFSFGIKSRRRGAHASDKAPPFPKKGLALGGDFGDMRVAETIIFPGSPDALPALKAGFVFSGLE